MTALSTDRLMEEAEKLGFTLDEEEAEVCAEAIQVLEESMAGFSAFESDQPPVFRTLRDPGYTPGPDEDPYNAIITRCHVKGKDEGPLSDRSVGLKDHVSVAGVPMTLGTSFFEGYIPRVDATVVNRLLEAGADVTAKLNMDHLSRAGMGLGSGTGDYGRCKNPHNPDHLTGGSSSGSGAAVATGTVDLAIGGDQGGSIRIPAAWCGVVGLKPTFGLVPHTGVVGTEPTVDYIGPMGRSVDEVALMLEQIAGPDGRDPRQPAQQPQKSYTENLKEGVDGFTLGILEEGFGMEASEPDVDEAVRASAALLGEAGASVTSVSVPEQDQLNTLLPIFSFLGHALSLDSLGVIQQDGYHDPHFIENYGRNLDSQSDRLPPPAKLSLLFKSHLGFRAQKYYALAQNIRRRLSTRYNRIFEDVDGLILPTVPVKAPAYTEPEDSTEAFRRATVRKALGVFVRNTCPQNMTGHPALSIPCALSDGLPVGMMLVGPRFADDRLLRIAYTFQEETDWESFFLT